MATSISADNADASVPIRPSALIWVAALLCVACILCTPFTYYRADVEHFAVWAQATHGTIPWDAYKAPECNYPVVTLYLLTLVEKLRLAAHAPFMGWLELVLIKLPNVIAMIAGVAICFYGLRERLGERNAKFAATAFGLCVPLWFNGVVWGQYDSIVCVALIGAVIALINDKPVWSGAALGFALAVKPQGIVLVPVFGMYALARRDWRLLAYGIIGAAAAWTALSAPFFLAGAGKYLFQYSVYPGIEVDAWNGWYLVHHIGGHLFHVQHIDRDDIKVLHVITLRQIGLLAYAAYSMFLFAGLWRQPTRYNCTLAFVLSAFSFFMLPTAIHERYIIMAVALAPILLTAVAPDRRKFAYTLYISLSVIGTLEHFVYCDFNYGPFTSRIAHIQGLLTTKLPIGLPASLFDIGLLIGVSVIYWRDVYQPSPGAPDLFAPSSSIST